MIPENELQDKILKVLEHSDVPLTASEIAQKLKIKRRIVLRRLQRLAVEGKVKGKRVNIAKGVWIWWI